MGKIFEAIDEKLADWLQAQPVFFVSTAPLSANGLVNCSPKGNRKEFVVSDQQTVAFVDQTGSGVETIAHLKENGRIVVMFCAFEGPPRIVRLHGRGEAVLRDDIRFGALADRFPGGTGVGVRSIVVVDVLRGSPADNGSVVDQKGRRGRPGILGAEEHREHRPPRGDPGPAPLGSALNR
jgi:hypothetical protein